MAYANPSITPEKQQEMNVKWNAKDRKKSTPAHFLKAKDKKPALAHLGPSMAHQNNHSVGNARSSNGSMVKNAESSLFNS